MSNNTGAPDHSQKANLEAIMHVPLEISVELGRVKLPLHTIARLNRGMVIEMNKEANAEVQILANGSIFAKGEVVSTGDKLGVRITEIVPPAARITTLS
ncbi:flagellar motor switch protein FliN [Mariprofundus erugo]|uniref:Flagellar motor switch protein FliN n=1 Tax=Mariprofundus erugo TaxID=2528639 RepID=A0A5R9GM01_9PROT|nr:FliM/FliN family flagellar motor switch protein [Mariprofundus erugo]TLS66708.1 flagellar motor switch protein FliN [Mariprofundus erugo]TLS78432.1 flagellar motor switch protein FliN [Mariprofundus erugo]